VVVGNQTSRLSLPALRQRGGHTTVQRCSDEQVDRGAGERASWAPLKLARVQDPRHTTWRVTIQSIRLWNMVRLRVRRIEHNACHMSQTSRGGLSMAVSEERSTPRARTHLRNLRDRFQSVAMKLRKRIWRTVPEKVPGTKPNAPPDPKPQRGVGTRSQRRNSLGL
jgi:hypothetical protein